MSIRPLLATMTAIAALLATTGTVRADAISAVNDFADQMAGRNVITSGNFSTNNHVHGTVAVGGNASLSGNAEINSHNCGSEALRVYGNLELSGETKVMAGGAVILQDGTVNTTVALHEGQPNPNQSVINYDSSSANTSPRLFFNGNGGTTPTLTSLSSDDGFFSSIDSVMQAAHTTLLSSASGSATIIDSDTIYFNATTSGVSVFTWDVTELTNIVEVGFSFASDDCYIVINIVGDTDTWNAVFTILGGSDYVAAHVLWNIAIDTVNLYGDQLLGSILAPNSTINSYKQLNGAIYAGELNQYGAEIHYTPPSPPSQVPDQPSLAVLALAGLSLIIPAWSRRRAKR